MFTASKPTHPTRIYDEAVSSDTVVSAKSICSYFAYPYEADSREYLIHPSLGKSYLWDVMWF